MPCWSRLISPRLSVYELMIVVLEDGVMCWLRMIARSASRMERWPCVSVSKTVSVVSFFCELINVLSLEDDWIRDAQAPRLPWREPSDPRTKDPVVMCDINCVSSLVVRARTKPSVHLSDIGSVRRYRVREVVIGGDSAAIEVRTVQ